MSFLPTIINSVTRALKDNYPDIPIFTNKPLDTTGYNGIFIVHISSVHSKPALNNHVFRTYYINILYSTNPDVITDSISNLSVAETLIGNLEIIPIIAQDTTQPVRTLQPNVEVVEPSLVKYASKITVELVTSVVEGVAMENLVFTKELKYGRR